MRPLGRTGLAMVASLALSAGAVSLSSAAPLHLPPANVGQVLSDADQPPMLMAQTQDEAQLVVRIQQLEEQVRTLSGQVDGLTFQLTNMQTLFDRMTKDNEARFQALEGGAGGKSSAATQSGGVTPAGALPQTAAPTDADAPATEIPEQGVKPLPGEAEIDPGFTDQTATDVTGIGASADPLAAANAPGAAASVPQPLDLNYNPGAVSTDNKDADAQYQAGYEAIQRGDYTFAEDQFSQYLALYPDSTQYSDAANWLGEALIQRQAYDEAADVLLTAFQKKPDSPRAPDLLLRLGISLSGAQERDTACRTFAEITKRYSNLTPAFKARLSEEQGKAQCPPG